MKDKIVSGILLMLPLITILSSMFNIQSVKADPTIISGWLTFPVTFDGKMTTVEEWSDTTPVDIAFLEDGVGPGNVSARVWMKNNDMWLYILHRVEWPTGDTDPLDSAGVAYLWDWIGEPPPLWNQSDGGTVRFDNVTVDQYGWMGLYVGWSLDTDASPPGDNNVEGAATHDGTYYWFELRKELDSGDGYDWSLTPGQIIETVSQVEALIVGLWDASPEVAYFEYISLHLSAPPPIMTTTIDIHPQALNLRSKGKWITAYIELLEGYDVADIDVSTILLNDTIPAELKPIAIGDYDNDTVLDLMVKFDRATVISYILANVKMTQPLKERFMTITLTITGKLDDGTPFKGSDTIKKIQPKPRGHGRHKFLI